MLENNFCFVKKPSSGDILKVPLNEWGSYRRQGYVFSTLDAYRAQDSKSAGEVVPVPDKPVKYEVSVNSSKRAILKFAARQNIEVTNADNKEDMLWSIAQVMGVSPSVFGVKEEVYDDDSV